MRAFHHYSEKPSSKLRNGAAFYSVFYTQGIERVLREALPSVSLLLENDVGAGNSLGHSFEQLTAILAMRPQYADRLGICLDTAHLWGCWSRYLNQGFNIAGAGTV